MAFDEERSGELALALLRQIFKEESVILSRDRAEECVFEIAQICKRFPSELNASPGELFAFFREAFLSENNYQVFDDAVIKFWNDGLHKR